jgi:hypothetical protein
LVKLMHLGFQHIIVWIWHLVESVPSSALEKQNGKFK